MTRIIVDLERSEDLQLLLQLLKRLRIPYMEQTQQDEEVAEALRILEKGCDMTSFGDPLEYQRVSREDRPLPHRES